MKNILYTIILSFLFSFSVFGEWTQVSTSQEHERYDGVFVDFETIKIKDGFVYFWLMASSEENKRPLKKNKPQSTKTFVKGDCDFFRTKYMSITFYDQPMGRGGCDSNSRRDGNNKNGGR
jgi:hypothetical protein